MKKIVYITATLPALTVTFIYNEIFRLREDGASVETVSMNTPDDGQISLAARGLRESTLYLDKVPAWRKWFSALFHGLRHPLRMAHCKWLWLTASPMQGPRDYLRLMYHLVEAAYLARRMRHKPPEHIHSHFINGPTSIAMFLGLLLDVPYSFTMHASMIWRDPIAFRHKLRTSAFCVSISEYNRRYVLETYGQRFADKIHVVHCGIDPRAVTGLPSRKAGGEKFRILAVGQLNRRKGFHVLIPALATLKRSGQKFVCTIIGEGAERPILEKLINEHDLGEQVTLAGAVLHEQVQAHLEAADAFVLPCVISEDGWRDGIPVALMEAMHRELPVISTEILGLPELIENGVSGLLVPAGEVEALAKAIVTLASDPEYCHRLGQNGRAKVLEEFNNDKSAARLHALIEAV
ncbi:MAG TPA: glycosyltransferase family 4 protein [Woeseiaceae bacterium]|nr:glycosyltransferase family 4 protein [Woeseiaceae bacterium]